jgi:hypothetical protein
MQVLPRPWVALFAKAVLVGKGPAIEKSPFVIMIEAFVEAAN